MPRRNNRAQTARRRPRSTAGAEQPPLTYEQIARRLVTSGRCSVLILDNPRALFGPAPHERTIDR